MALKSFQTIIDTETFYAVNAAPTNIVQSEDGQASYQLKPTCEIIDDDQTYSLRGGQIIRPNPDTFMSEITSPDFTGPLKIIEVVPNYIYAHSSSASQGIILTGINVEYAIRSLKATNQNIGINSSANLILD